MLLELLILGSWLHVTAARRGWRSPDQPPTTIYLRTSPRQQVLELATDTRRPEENHSILPLLTSAAVVGRRIPFPLQHTTALSFCHRHQIQIETAQAQTLIPMHLHLLTQTFKIHFA